MASKHYLALDVGEKRIGVALADDAIKIAVAYDTIAVDGTEVQQIADLLRRESIDVLVIGYPRNQSGEATKQTEYVERFAAKLASYGAPIVYQDESVTSVQAETILKNQKQPYQKADIDALAASLILQDYMESL